jgi:hypothetical protein
LPGDTTLELDRPDHDGLVAENLLPVGHEGFAIASHEIRHPARLRIRLIFEEDGKIVPLHSPKTHLGGHDRTLSVTAP